MSDCTFFMQVIKELNPADTNTGDCCSWNMVECDNQHNIVKIDLSNYNGINNKASISQNIMHLNNLKEFSIRGQSNIYDITSLSNSKLEKVDLSNSGMNSSIFPTWLVTAPNLKEIDISNSKITGLPQSPFEAEIKSCNFYSTPICDTYASSPYDFIPASCKESCVNGSISSGSIISNGKSKSGSGSTIWPYFLIGAGCIVLAIVAGLFVIRRRKNKNDNTISYDSSSPEPILPISNKKHTESIDISVSETSSKNIPNSAMLKSNSSDSNIEEVAARSNNSNAYAGNMSQSAFYSQSGYASTKDIYRQQNNAFEPDQSYQQHPSIYNTMTTDNSSNLSNNSEIIKNEIINEPPAAAVSLKSMQEDINGKPNLLRRKSSRKNNGKKNVAPSVQSNQTEESKQEIEGELYIANWDYNPTLSDELALVAGDVIEVRKKFDDGWCSGYNRRTKSTGIIPLCYLKEYED